MKSKKEKRLERELRSADAALARSLKRLKILQGVRRLDSEKQQKFKAQLFTARKKRERAEIERRNKKILALASTGKYSFAAIARMVDYSYTQTRSVILHERYLASRVEDGKTER